MDLAEARQRLRAAEEDIPRAVWAVFATFERDGRSLHLCVTDRLRRRARKQHLWAGREMLSARKNASYGYDERNARSPGGRDGIYLLDRDHRPENEMMRRLFTQYLDKSDSGVADVAEELGVGQETLLPVRLVSHHMRLLGVLARVRCRLAGPGELRGGGREAGVVLSGLRMWRIQTRRAAGRKE